MSTKLFMTHHSPTGAWSSLTFGHPDAGVSIDLEDPKIKDSGTLLAGLVRGDQISSIAFSGDANLKASYGGASADAITRTLTASKDIYSYKDITFTTFTPYLPLQDPEKEDILDINCIPAILLQVTIDNTGSSEAATAFFGLGLNDAKRAYATSEDGLHLLTYKDEWELACLNQEGSGYIRGLDSLNQLKKGQSIVQQNGLALFTLNVPAGAKKSLTLSWSVYKRLGCNGTIEANYYYTKLFRSLRSVTKACLGMADELIYASSNLDKTYNSSKASDLRKELFYQSLRGYYASSQLLIDKDNLVHWNISEGGYIWRNTMDLCADHITWELKQNPWVVRSLMDDFLKYYTYKDQVTFNHREGIFPGGISFTHDMGCYFTYSKPGFSAYERENDNQSGFYFYMTTEELLNGIYCISSYVLSQSDLSWLDKHPGLLSDLMESLENRDDCLAEDRNGILKARTLRGGACRLESTTYDALDHSLLDASGNVYVFIKTWCSLIMLKKAAKLSGNEEVYKRAERMIGLCQESAGLFISNDHLWLKANAYKDIPGAVIAAIEPLAVPYALGILEVDKELKLIELIRNHVTGCLKTGLAIDEVSGGLRLSSTSTNTWPSKSVLVIYVIEEILKMSLPADVVAEVINWCQVSASRSTISDQINAETRQIIGAPYYPRIVTSCLLL